MARHTKKPNPSAEWPDYYLIFTTHKDAPFLGETGILTRADAIKEIHDGQIEDVLCVHKISETAPREDVTADICKAIGELSFDKANEPFSSLSELLDRFDVDYYRERDNERALRYVGRGL